jgi:hypothetical protein
MVRGCGRFRIRQQLQSSCIDTLPRLAIISSAFSQVNASVRTLYPGMLNMTAIHHGMYRMEYLLVLAQSLPRTSMCNDHRPKLKIGEVLAFGAATNLQVM